MKNLSTKMIRASSWVLGSNVVSQAISFAFGIVLARLLVPDDFGLIAMVLAITGLAGLFSDVGLGAALVQRKDATEEHFSSVFWLNLSVGGVLTVVIYFSSSLISQFYERTEVEAICQVLSISFVISALAMVPRIRFVKKLAFKYIALADFVSMVLSGGIAIYLATQGFGFWSLVALKLSQVIISTAVIVLASRWVPKTLIKWSALSDLYGFSFNVFGTELVQYIAKSADRILLGKYLGGEPLGLYDKAHSMMLFPLQNISHVIGSVMFPTFSLIQTDVDRVRNIYLRCVRVIALFAFPMMTGIFVVAEPFVLGVLGAHWSDLIPVLQIFCVAGVVRSVVTVTGAIYKSLGAVALQLKLNMIMQPLQILGVVAGLPWGVIGVVTGYTVAQAVNGVITLTVAGRLINLRLGTLLYSLAPTLVLAIIMASLVALIEPVLGIENYIYLFLIQVMAGIMIYWGIVASIRLRAYKDLTGVLGAEFFSRQT